MGDILVGTSSWTDKTLLQSKWYPSGNDSAEARLRYYASRFRITEVDSSFYGLPTERNSLLWEERTPAGFVFNVKAFRLFTGHRTPLVALPADLRQELVPRDKEAVYYRDVPAAVVEELWRRFRSALEPLRASGRLGAVLLQFAPWFLVNPKNLAHIEHCAAALQGFRVAVEMRHRSWLDERHTPQTLALVRRLGAAHVVVDEPQGFASSVPAVWQATCPLAVVRLHGRNSDTWAKQGLASAAQRFAYLYSPRELASLALPVRDLAAGAEHTHVIFNNCFQDYAQRNAVDFGPLLEQAG